MRLLVPLFALALAGCASTPRGDATNACNFVFFASLHAVLPVPPVAYAGICTFGLELVSDGEKKVKKPVAGRALRTEQASAPAPSDTPATVAPDPLREALDEIDEKEDEEEDEEEDD